jgi:hypothetical protein
VIGSTRNVTRVRRAIPIVQPGNSRYATAFFDTRQVSGSARNLAQVRRAGPVAPPGRSRYATTFFNSRAGTEQRIGPGATLADSLKK